MALDKDALETLRMDPEQRTPDARRRRRTLMIVSVGVAALALSAVAVIRGLSGGPAVVSTETVQAPSAEGGSIRVLNASGYVVARRKATVSSKVTGKLQTVDVEEGMRVSEGQVLARLDDSTATAQAAVASSELAAARSRVTAAAARAAQAKQHFQRVEDLYRQALTSQAALDDARADAEATASQVETARREVAVARDHLELAQRQLDDLVIRAPFDGVVTSKDAQPGEMVSPISAGGGFTRTGICTIVDMTSLEVEVDVNEAYLQRVSDGQETETVLDAYPDWRIPSHVISIVPTADRQKATVKVRIGLDRLDPRILPDMAAQVWFYRAASEAESGGATVPAVAVRGQGGQSYVWVVRDGGAHKQTITTGARQGDRITVLSGLAGGEQVVVESARPLTEGMAVRPGGSRDE
ncbi:MAG: efflux RND transporter periplasmic adaptor subunit [Gammaproteobacteria bacterium]